MAKVLAIGAVLWDIFEEEMHIGGAPFNVAAHCVKRGLEASILTSVGKDELGDKAYEAIGNLGVGREFVQIDDVKPTGTAKVSFKTKGIPEYDIPFDVAFNNIRTTKELLAKTEENDFDFIYFGSMEQKSEVNHHTIKEVLARKKQANIFFDVNIRFGFYQKEIIEYSLFTADIVKINDEEALILSSLLYGEEMSYEEFAKKAAKDYNISIFVTTLGKEGCIVYTASNDTFDKARGFLVDVVDTVGAGDAFCAAFMDTLVRTGDPVKAAVEGNRLGAYVASKRGAIPDIVEKELAKITV